jgi:uncharacterized membrane protein
MTEASESVGANLLHHFIHWLQLGAETSSAIIIGVGVVTAAYQLARLLLPVSGKSYQEIRFYLSRHLALALEFQLAADLLGTVTQPSWEQLGKLGAIAAIRTFLNYFLAREIKEERSEVEKNAPAS